MGARENVVRHQEPPRHDKVRYTVDHLGQSHEELAEQALHKNFPEAADKAHMTRTSRMLQEATELSGSSNSNRSYCDGSCYYAFQGTEGQGASCRARVNYLESIGEGWCSSIAQVNNECVGQCLCTPFDLNQFGCNLGDGYDNYDYSEDGCDSSCDYAFQGPGGAGASCRTRIDYLASNNETFCSAINIVNNHCAGQCTCTPSAVGQPECISQTGGGVCFPGESNTHVEGKGLVEMNLLEIGDHVLAGRGFHEPAFALLHTVEQQESLAVAVQPKTHEM